MSESESEKGFTFLAVNRQIFDRPSLRKNSNFKSIADQRSIRRL
jgi:hypothetical protein